MYISQVALKLVKLVTGVAYTISPEWRAYTEAESRTGVKTAPLRTLSEDRFDCLVPIRRPSRLDGLKVCAIFNLISAHALIYTQWTIYQLYIETPING